MQGQAAGAWSIRAGADDGVTVVGHGEGAVGWNGVTGSQSF